MTTETLDAALLSEEQQEALKRLNGAFRLIDPRTGGLYAIIIEEEEHEFRLTLDDLRFLKAMNEASLRAIGAEMLAEELEERS